jgi:hypothetical protein
MAREQLPTISAGVWLHQKGRLYLVLGVARDENNDSPHDEP